MLARSLRRAFGISPIAFAAVLVLAGCGGGDGGDIIGPPPGENPGPTPSPEPEPEPGPAPVGYAIYAVDFANRLLLFGTESPTVISRIVPITGLPILKRIVGIDFRPSDGRLYGVGNDSRVYVINTGTGEATPVGDKFAPEIASFFDIHFGMGFEPGSERIRLISAELGINWSIDPDDGSATTGGALHYVEGDEHETETPHISGLAYVPAGSPALQASVARLQASSDDPCEKVMVAIDADLAEYIGSCDPDSGAFESLGPLNEIVARCSEVKFGPDGNLFGTMLRGAQAINSLGTVDPNTGWVTWHGDVPDDSPIQGFAFAPEGTVEGSQSHAATAGGRIAASAAASPSGDPRAHCPGT